MGKPSLGAAAKTSVGSCRMTEAEKAAIIAKYGTVATFFRLKVDEELRSPDRCGPDGHVIPHRGCILR